MTDFIFYLQMGWDHIMSQDALDHQLFMLALAAVYLPSNWRQVLVLVTAFTIGHSVTLALSTFKLVTVNSRWTEFLIPCTIVITAFFNLRQRQYNQQTLRLNYWLALGFGLVHGLGFANAIRFMLADAQHIAGPLFSFNLGLELGQLTVVSVILLAAWLVVNKAGLRQRWWVWGLSLAALGTAGFIAADRIP